MALRQDDPRPTGISLQRAYSAVRTWYRGAIRSIQTRQDSYGRASTDFIRSLPPTSKISPLELRAVLAEVICGYLEWGYRKSDGRFKMGAYAHAALDAAGLSYNLTDRERERLRRSPLGRRLSFCAAGEPDESESRQRFIVAGDCDHPNCPLRGGAHIESDASSPMILSLMSVGGGLNRTPKGEFIDLVRKVHRGREVREVVLTDPYIYSDAGDHGTTGGYSNLVEYLLALNLRSESTFVLKVKPDGATSYQNLEGAP